MEKERFEEIIKKYEDLFAEGKTEDEIRKQIKEELSDKEIEEFVDLLVKRTYEYLEKSKRNKK
jgi:F0F1-type ATP synthase delta subunit